MPTYLNLSTWSNYFTHLENTCRNPIPSLLLNLMEQISHVTIPLLSESELREFFVDHLNRIYCAKSHLVRRFPELAEQAGFLDVKHAILETTQDVENQISRMAVILTLMNEIH